MKNSDYTIAKEFIHISRHQLKLKTDRIFKCVEKLTIEQIWSRTHNTENSIGNLIHHLSGSIQQWVLSGIEGRPNERNRDEEFERREPIPTDQLLKRLSETVSQADRVLENLTAPELLSERKVKFYDVTVLEAIYHIVEHLSGHTGQIISATKRMTGASLGFSSSLTRNNESNSIRSY